MAPTTSCHCDCQQKARALSDPPLLQCHGQCAMVHSIGSSAPKRHRSPPPMRQDALLDRPAGQPACHEARHSKRATHGATTSGWPRPFYGRLHGHHQEYRPGSPRHLARRRSRPDCQQGVNPAETNKVKPGAPSITSRNAIICRLAVYVWLPTEADYSWICGQRQIPMAGIGRRFKVSLRPPQAAADYQARQSW